MTQSAEPSARDAEIDQRVGQHARDRGYVSEDQLNESVDVQALASRHFGRPVPLLEVLYIRGLIDVEHLHFLQDAVGSRPRAPTQLGSRSLFGKIAVEKGFIAAEHVLRCLDVQRDEVKVGKSPRPLGAILVAQGYLTEVQIQEILQLQRSAQS